MPRVFLVKAITPRKRMDQQGFIVSIMAALEKEGRVVKRMYEKTTRTWSRPRPVFKIEVKYGKPPGPQGGRESRPASVDVFTESDKYRWVDEGTKRHWIAPKRAKMLRWRTGGKPKTKPRVIGSTKGARGSGPWASSKGHWHPGTKPREFSKEIMKRRKSAFHKNMAKAIREATKRHAW